MKQLGKFECVNYYNRLSIWRLLVDNMANISFCTFDLKLNMAVWNNDTTQILLSSSEEQPRLSNPKDPNNKSNKQRASIYATM
uniref:Uncharacterized protein n=1 Tax=Romanomermis culicivorax TaxID=13658 RepID=A0A915JIM4_ROMCU